MPLHKSPMFVGGAGIASVAILTDTKVRVTVTPYQGLPTAVYRDSVLVGTIPAGSTILDDDGLTPATNYSYTVRASFGGILGVESSPTVARPVMSISGGSVTDISGIRYHLLTADDSLTYNRDGHVSYRGVGCGGKGGDGNDVGGGEVSGGGGGASGFMFSTDNTLEPAGTYAVQVGSNSNSGATTYRSENAPKGQDGVAGLTTAGGDGGDNNLHTGGQGATNGAGNASGGGGGAGLAGNGTNATNIGGVGGAGTSLPVVGTVGAGGKGGRGLGTGAAGANLGDGGDGNAGSGNSGGLGHSGFFLVWYPI